MDIWLIVGLIVGGLGLIFGAYFYIKRRNEKLDFSLMIIGMGLDVFDKLMEAFDKDLNHDNAWEIGIDVAKHILVYFQEIKQAYPELKEMTEEQLVKFLKEKAIEEMEEYLAVRNIELSKEQKDIVKTILDVVVFFAKQLFTKK